MTGGLTSNGHYRAMQRAYHRFKPAKQSKQSGFTVIEVMIVLAVSALIFVAAASQISGRQNRTAFEVAIREVQSQIQKTINEVSTGFYPNLSNFQCTGNAASGVVISAGSAGQGTNSGCIFLGKALQFKVNGTAPEQFATFSIAGVQQGGAGGAESSTLAEAKPLAINSTNTVTLPSATETDTLQSGMTAVDMWYMNGASKRTIGVVAFTASLAQYSGGTLQSGSQTVNLVPIDPSALSTSKLDATEAINTRITSSPIDPTSGVFVCFRSGTTEQSGLVTIGSNGRQLTVGLQIKGNTTCA